MLFKEKGKDIMDKPQIRLSVRNLIEFLLKGGDIMPLSLAGYEVLNEGTRVHRRIQAEAGDDYRPEVRLAYERDLDAFSLRLEGIADGIIENEKGVTIDEIKSTRVPLDLIDHDFAPIHWAQTKCYAWMYCCQEKLETISINLTYVNVDTDELKRLSKDFSYPDLKAFIDQLIGQYEKWGSLAVGAKARRDESIGDLAFPFDQYRRGQRDLAAYVYRTIRDKEALFAQAPTGIGKTMAVLFSSIKAMGEGMGEKIFYLTAKTVTRQVAEQAVLILEDRGLIHSSITLTAKDKICLNDTVDCDPDLCPYAKGHYDRVNDAVYDILTNERLISRETLLDYGKRHRVCPFEYGLDISLWADIIICDYNYAFDPRAYLRRFFEYGGDYTLLIDEAHNLVERARDMYSAAISKKAFMNHRAFLKEAIPEAYKEFNRINRLMIDLRKTIGEKTGTRLVDFPNDLVPLLDSFCLALSDYLKKRPNRAVDPTLIDLYFDCLAFVAVSKLYNQGYSSYITRSYDELIVKLFCIDPSYLISKACKKARASIFFSATLQPIDYFLNSLGAGPDTVAINLPSPFPSDHLCLMVATDVSTRYRDRDYSYERIAHYIRNTTSLRTGNYLVFFPSYAYMESVYDLYIDLWPEDRTLKQDRFMDDEQREAFLASFEQGPRESLIGFAVMGGIFSEGIDLTGDRLSGAIIVGVGLPQLCPERDIIRDYFKEQRDMGYEYAYMYPGMNRVLQAAGRVIRSEDDRGFVLLIDNRFLYRSYLDLFPDQWLDYTRVGSAEAAAYRLNEFYNSNQ